jgi:hypothetical protein
MTTKNILAIEGETNFVLNDIPAPSFFVPEFDIVPIAPIRGDFIISTPEQSESTVSY